MRDTTFFHFSKLFLIQNYRFLYHGDQKISWWTLQVAGSQLRNPPVKFRHERWLHLATDLHPACPNRGRLELWPRNDSFWDKSVTLSMLIDLLTSTCRSTQVKIASTDLWPQGMFTFSEMLALVESESSFGAYVCHRRPGGSLATSDLVRRPLSWRNKSGHAGCACGRLGASLWWTFLDRLCVLQVFHRHSRRLSR